MGCIGDCFRCDATADMALLKSKGKIDARPVLQGSAAVTSGEQRTCKWCGRLSSRVKDTEAGPLCGVCQLSVFTATRSNSDSFSQGNGSVVAHESAGFGAQPALEGAADSDIVTAGMVGMKRAAPAPTQRRRTKRECPASIFVGVQPFWSGDRILYRIRLRCMGKEKEYGQYTDENTAALARDYASRRIAKLTNSKARQMNSDQFFLEDDVEMAKLDRWINKLLDISKRKTLHGVTVRVKAGGAEEFRVRVWIISTKLVDFGTYADEEFACLVADYVCRDLLNRTAENYLEKFLEGQEDLKSKLSNMLSSASATVPVALAHNAFADVKAEFWDAVQYGPEFVCCYCHQLWFWKSVKPVTDNLISKVSMSCCASARTGISSWLCGTCYGYLSQCKIRPVCHIRYDPFPDLPEELRDLNAVENDLIALRIPFMKLRALNPSVRGGSKKFGQLCLRGMVINVPTDLSLIRTELPRDISADETVTVNIKRKLRYKGCCETENVRPLKILRALQFLTTHDTLWREAGVRLRP